MTLVAEFELWLGAAADTASPADIARFVARRSKPESAKTVLWALALYFESVERPGLADQARELRRGLIHPSPVYLRDIVGVPEGLVKRLAQQGIRTADHLVAAATDSVDELAALASMDPTGVEDLYQTCRLTAIRGVKGIRARLYRETVGTLEGLAATTPEGLVAVTSAYIVATGFSGVPPTPKEAAASVTAAQQLTQIGTQ